MSTKSQRKTPTPEKVRRRLFEHWEVVRRKPAYRKAYRERDLNTLAQFGIDADPNDPAPVERLDLLQAIHTDYSIDTRKVISGALFLYETPWVNEEGNQQWRQKREAVFVLDSDVTLEEIREGIEHALKFRRRYWMKARRLIGPVPLNPVRLVDPNKAGEAEADRVREMLLGYTVNREGVSESIFKAPFPPVLLVDPLQPLGQMRKEIHAVLKDLGANRERPKRRWRRTTKRDIRAFDLMIKPLLRFGKQLEGRTTLSKKLGVSKDQARRSMKRARRDIAPLEDAALIEHLLCCQKCQKSPPCKVFNRLADQASGIKQPRESQYYGPAESRQDEMEPETDLDHDYGIKYTSFAPPEVSKSRYPFLCPVCHKRIRSQKDALKNHHSCGEAIRARKRDSST